LNLKPSKAVKAAQKSVGNQEFLDLPQILEFYDRNLEFMAIWAAYFIKNWTVAFHDRL